MVAVLLLEGCLKVAVWNVELGVRNEELEVVGCGLWIEMVCPQ